VGKSVIGVFGTDSLFARALSDPTTIFVVVGPNSMEDLDELEHPSNANKPKIKQITCGRQMAPLPNFRLTGLAQSNPAILSCYWGLRMKDVYEVLRQKELEKSRLENEIKALRVVAPILSEDGEAEADHQPTLQRAVNDTPQPDHSGWQDRGKRYWPLSSS
jgi:hypothetical protein